MVIVENKSELEQFYQEWNTTPCYIIPIWQDLEKHPLNNKLSFLYVSFDREDYVLPFNHNDCLSISNAELSQSTMYKMVWNKKGFLQTGLNIKGLHDMQADIFFNTNELYPLEDKLEGLTSFYTRMGVRDNLGEIIPIMKWVEVLSSVVQEIKNLPINQNFGKNWVDTQVIPILSEIEKPGLKVDTQKFFDRWDATKHLKHLDKDTIYTEYNPYIITSRPSNRHGGINFSALNKEDGTREVFVPRENHVFVQMDYDAYHIRIMAELVGFNIPYSSGHAWLAEQYGCSYEESKGRTFRNIYGGIEDTHIPFFYKVDEFIQTFWKDTQRKGYVQTKHRKIPLEFIEKPNPQKVFNYLLQSLETELNMDVLSKLIAKNYIPVLYAYDSFLFDIPKDTELVLDIKKEVESLGFPVKLSVGDTYSDI